MGVKLTRQKQTNKFISGMYWAQKFLPLSNFSRFKLFLNLEWLFDRLSHQKSFKYYSPETHPIRQRSKKFLLDNLETTSIVLDLGCKLGDVSVMLAEKARKVVGIDFDKVAIDLAKNRHQKSNLEFHCGEALEFLKSSPEKFDVLILSHILEHLDNPQEFLQSFKDSFESIYIEVPDFDRNYLNHYRKDLNLKLIYSDNDHISEFDRDELKAILKNCDLHVVSEEYRYGVIKLWCRRNKSAK